MFSGVMLPKPLSKILPQQLGAALKFRCDTDAAIDFAGRCVPDVPIVIALFMKLALPLPSFSHRYCDNEENGLDLFAEPTDYYKPEKQPTQVQHQTLSHQTLTLHLVGSSPLWGHLLWNAGRTIADYLEQNKATLLKDKTVLELGAGAGLPSLIAALNGAAHVVVTDYPDHDLVANLQKNIDSCDVLPSPRNISAAGFLWGADVSSLVEQLPSKGPAHGFDLLILADLLFNHSEHHKLVRSVQDALTRSPSAQALVFFTPYRPWLFQKDLAFFDLAREGGFVVEKILEKTMEKVMFEEDPGDELLRRTVFGYSLRWAS
ncbi:uncharacterized protein K489DRAFT_401039 [Dissoconium aciculare CBS 342.82]|uniref:Protein N-terminal and lysine N-methyltransferase EFM7 n=1 Tax=Dissoconium aciculare CBS 342.82 TaxID=1314786 RepID=A0A6J3M853_9PEZI|nr:uncharacterized protein K489DRAFT_401039 [Dissoconium aciculare CBS 342.82]KAF1823769.1 hypothetical protein K489DRAFT_401039 [Dissoconium aciculare CBS 342.82]